jgi:uncharacterized membrane protein YfcA
MGDASAACREFLLRIVPLGLLTASAGVVASYLQHGFLIGGARGVPLAGDASVSLWHLFLLGFVAGYVMALVGQAGGSISLPYAVSVLGFDTIHVTPTVQLETLIGPVGAQLSYRRAGQWNRDFALVLCGGAVVGGAIGPFVRLYWLADPSRFKSVVGAAMVWTAIQLLSLRRPQRQSGSQARTATGGDAVNERATLDSSVTTLAKNAQYLQLGFRDRTWQLWRPGLLLLGCGVGVIASMLGLGGGFLLVPLLATVYRLPIQMIVAGSIPFTISLSAASLFSYNVSLPLVTGQHVSAEWAWGLFTSSTAILGSWCGARSQRYLPESWLRTALGILTGGVGCSYLYRGLGELFSAFHSI